MSACDAALAASESYRTTTVLNLRARARIQLEVWEASHSPSKPQQPQQPTRVRATRNLVVQSATSFCRFGLKLMPMRCDLQGALADSNAILALDPGNAEAMFNRAAAYFGLKDYTV